MELKKPVEIIRHIIGFGSLLVMFFNLYDCIIGNKTFFHYFVTVVLFVGVFIYMMFSKGVFPVVLVLMICATLTMLYDTLTNNISYACIWFVLAIYLDRCVWIRVISYFISLFVVVGVSIVYRQSSAAFINYLIGYIIVYGLSELVYLEMSNRFKRKE